MQCMPSSVHNASHSPWTHHRGLDGQLQALQGCNAHTRQMHTAMTILSIRNRMKCNFLAVGLFFDCKLELHAQQ